LNDSNNSSNDSNISSNVSNVSNNDTQKVNKTIKHDAVKRTGSPIKVTTSFTPGKRNETHPTDGEHSHDLGSWVESARNDTGESEASEFPNETKEEHFGENENEDEVGDGSGNIELNLSVKLNNITNQDSTESNGSGEGEENGSKKAMLDLNSFVAEAKNEKKHPKNHKHMILDFARDGVELDDDDEKEATANTKTLVPGAKNINIFIINHRNDGTDLSEIQEIISQQDTNPSDPSFLINKTSTNLQDVLNANDNDNLKKMVDSFVVADDKASTVSKKKSNRTNLINDDFFPSNKSASDHSLDKLTNNSKEDANDLFSFVKIHPVPLLQIFNPQEKVLKSKVFYH